MHSGTLKTLFKTYKESSLSHRYICNDHIDGLLKKLTDKLKIVTIGHSVNGEKIQSINFGTGKKRILLWSQMHGNESTTTKALFDLLNTLSAENDLSHFIESSCQIVIIPILNPDGARAYTRVNANNIDLNRDAQDLSQSESIALRTIYDNFKPHFCFNLHGQRTIFGVGKTKKPATVSFLAPAEDDNCTITETRQKAMEVISVLNSNLQMQIPGQVGIYDDSFNINCVGDTFQSLGSATILFEAGHFKNDYPRDITRNYIYQSLILAIHYIGSNNVEGNNHKPYFEIPKNEKTFFDILIRNAKFDDCGILEVKDVGIIFQEVLADNKVVFIPKIERIDNLNDFHGHIEVDAKEQKVFTHEKKPVYLEYENDFVFINDEKYSLKSTIS